MKKIIAILLTIVMIFSLISCGETATTTTTMTTTETENPIGLEQPANKVYYRRGHLFSESETRLLFFSNPRTLSQYNKFTEEINPFCFDPLCAHGKDCISFKFHHLSGTVGNGSWSMQYCEYDKRYYFTRGEQIYSVSFDGSDAKIACSFGETGKFENDGKSGNNYGGANAVSFMSIYDRYVYFFTVDSEAGIRTLKRYDVETDAVIDVLKKEKAESTVTFYGVIDGYLYACLVGEVYGVYRMNLDGSDMVKVHDDIIDQNYVWGIFDGTCAYAIIKTPDGITNLTSYSIVTGETEIVHSSDRYMTLCAVTKDKLYYITQFPISEEEQKKRGTEQNTYCRFYCVDKNTKEVTIVLDDISMIDIKDFHFLGDTVYISGSAYIDGKNLYERIFTAKINENGIFTELTELN